MRVAEKMAKKDATITEAKRRADELLSALYKEGHDGFYAVLGLIEACRESFVVESEADHEYHTYLGECMVHLSGRDKVR